MAITIITAFNPTAHYTPGGLACRDANQVFIMTPETLAAIGALLGALGAFIPHISSWLKDRSQYGLERRKMDLAIKEIDFISK